MKEVMEGEVSQRAMQYPFGLHMTQSSNNIGIATNQSEQDTTKSRLECLNIGKSMCMMDSRAMMTYRRGQALRPK